MTTFKKGDVVKCVVADKLKELVVGKEYVVDDVEINYLRINGIENDAPWYLMSRFELVKPEKELWICPNANGCEIDIHCLLRKPHIHTGKEKIKILDNRCPQYCVPYSPKVEPEKEQAKPDKSSRIRELIEGFINQNINLQDGSITCDYFKNLDELVEKIVKEEK